jgi:hypothetical protein
MPWNDENDWIGEPPEGHHSADRARPGFWLVQRFPEVIAAAVLVGLVVVVLVLLLR